MNQPTQARAYPHFHRSTPYAGESSLAAEEFAKLLSVWHKAADVMKTQPAGSAGVIEHRDIGHAYLMMVAHDDELELFWASSQEATGIWTPELGEDLELAEIRSMHRAISEWLEDPLLAALSDPAAIKGAWQGQFCVEVDEQWVWSGNSPVLTPYTVFCRQSDNIGTTYIGVVEAFDLASASQAAIKQCSDEWMGYDPEKIVCTGVIEGNVNVLHWDDQVE